MTQSVAETWPANIQPERHFHKDMIIILNNLR